MNRRPPLERPPRVASVLGSIWLAVFVFTHSDSGVPFSTWIALAASGMLLMVWWALRITIALFRDRAAVRNERRIWSILPAAAVAALLASSTTVPIKVRLYLGSGALIRAAPALAAAGNQELWFSPRRVGLYRVRQFWAYGSELRFLTNECGLVDNCGFVFSPSGPPPNRGEDSFVHLYGNWWHWYQSW